MTNPCFFSVSIGSPSISLSFSLLQRFRLFLSVQFVINVLTVVVYNRPLTSFPCRGRAKGGGSRTYAAGSYEPPGKRSTFYCYRFRVRSTTYYYNSRVDLYPRLRGILCWKSSGDGPVVSGGFSALGIC